MLSKEDTPDVAIIAQSAIVEGGLNISHYKGGWFSKPSPVLGLSEDGACACSMLSDDADWNCVWDFTPHAISKIVITLTKIHELCSHGWVFEALWIGDKPKEEMHLSLEEVVQLVRSSRIGQKARYVVKK